jgi:endonuclease/exonuclease/phosphatase family metal-dependent hydrolase
MTSGHRPLQPLIAALLLCCCLLSSAALAGEPVELRLMSFNMWGAGANAGLPIDQTVAVLRAANADIIGLQESRAEGDACSGPSCAGAGEDRSAAIAAALGYYHYLQAEPNEANWFNAIISRYPIIEALPHDLGVVIEVHGQRVNAFNIHATDYPYQPFQLLGIEYDGAPFLDTAGQAIVAASTARAGALALLRESVAGAGPAALEVVFGDFNEPSHRDWSEAAAAIGRHPLAVAYPLVLALEQDGFIDALRAVYPDEISKPAYTWTPFTAPDDPGDHHDRIDYVLVRGAGLVISAAQIVGEQAPQADLVVQPWPSDHRAVLVTVQLPASPTP